jgi:hypothetical protein
MIQTYLIINAISYLVFTLWCLFKPSATAGSLGYSFLNNSGRVEFLSVYTGLELGFTVFLFLCALYPAFEMAGLLFCVSIYGGLMVVRPISSIAYGSVSKITWVVGVMEYILGIWGIILLINQ